MRKRKSAQSKRTIGLVAETLGNLTLLHKVNVPALGLASRVLESEGVYALAGLHGILLGLRVGQDGVERVKDGRGGELVCDYG